MFDHKKNETLTSRVLSDAVCGLSDIVCVLSDIVVYILTFFVCVHSDPRDGELEQQERDAGHGEHAHVHPPASRPRNHHSLQERGDKENPSSSLKSQKNL